MPYERFHDFVKHNIHEIDALSRRYADYRLDVSKKYLTELSGKIASAVPDGYAQIQGSLKADVENWWGWQRSVDIFGTSSSVNIAFALSCDLNAFAGQWPLASQRCWTGIFLWMRSQPEAEQFRKILISMGGETKERGNKSPWWLCWRPWKAFADVPLEVLLEHLTGPESTAGQDAIVRKLLEWTEIFERAEASAKAMS